MKSINKEKENDKKFTVVLSNRKLFGERLKKVVKDTGFSQDAFADSIGVSRASLKNWIAGSFAPDADALRIIQEKCGCSLDWLITGNSETTGNAPLDEVLLTEIVEYIDSEFKFEKAKNKAPLIVKIYAYILKKRTEREASKEKDTAEIIDLIEILKSAV